MTYTFVLTHLRSDCDAPITSIDGVNDVGKTHLKKIAPGVIDVFDDIDYVYDPMSNTVGINEELTVTTDDEILYNRLVLLNPDMTTNRRGIKFLSRVDSKHTIRLEIHKEND